MKFNSNKEKGNTGLGIAIAYYSANGYTIKINNSYYTGKLLYSSDTDDGKTSDSYIDGRTGNIISNTGTAVTSEIDLVTESSSAPLAILCTMIP